MRVSERNYNKVRLLFHFCRIYTAHRDFDLAKRVAKNNPLNWQQAESLSDFCNQLVLTKESKPQDFISENNESANNAIDNFLVLKSRLNSVKNSMGAKSKNTLYKAVKVFYKKKMYCYQMDSFFTWVVYGFFMYVKGLISFEEFKKNHYFEFSLFTGEKKSVKTKQVIKISQCILQQINQNNESKL